MKATIKRRKDPSVNPRIYGRGKVDRRFKEMAEKANLEPSELLTKMVKEGATQSDLAELLGCTRQAVGILGRRYGIEFPGAKLDIDEKAKEKGCKNFDDYYMKYYPTKTQRDMAVDLEVSIATMKRRIKAVLRSNMAK